MLTVRNNTKQNTVKEHFQGKKDAYLGYISVVANCVNAQDLHSSA